MKANLKASTLALEDVKLYTIGSDSIGVGYLGTSQRIRPPMNQRQSYREGATCASRRKYRVVKGVPGGSVHWYTGPGVSCH